MNKWALKIVLNNGKTEWRRVQWLAKDYQKYVLIYQILK